MQPPKCQAVNLSVPIIQCTISESPTQMIETVIHQAQRCYNPCRLVRPIKVTGGTLIGHRRLVETVVRGWNMLKASDSIVAVAPSVREILQKDQTT